MHMSRDGMIEALSDQGKYSGSEYSDRMEGWFGWSVKDGRLTVTYQCGDGASKDEYMWTLTEVEP